MRIPYEAPRPFGRQFIELAPDVVAAILRTILGGWERACGFDDVNAEAGEVPMTERLRDGMREELKVSPWGKSVIVLAGAESRSTPAVLQPDGRTDIPLMLIEIFLRAQEHDPHAIIECKRVAGADTYLCREYVVEGIDRFVTGKYGGNHAVGFMVGYLLSGSLGSAVSCVNSYLKRASRGSELLGADHTWAHTSCWKSQHVRTSPAALIRLRHVFLGMKHHAAYRSTAARTKNMPSAQKKAK